MLINNEYQLEKLKIMLVDEKPYFRKGMRDLLWSRFTTQIDDIKEAGNSYELFSLLSDYQPNIMFIDIDLPELSGIQTTQLVHEKYPGIKIVALSAHDEPNYVHLMMDAGANDFLSKNEELPTRISVIINNMSDNHNPYTTTKNDTEELFISLLFECPLHNEQATCVYKDIRKEKFSQRLKWMKSLSKDEKRALLLNHTECMLKNA